MAPKAEIHILLLSRDESLADCCREVVSAMFASESTVAIGLPGQPAPHADLYLWDFVAEESALPASLDAAHLSRYVFLVSRQHFPALRALTGTLGIHILLKPLQPDALRAFLDDTVQRKILGGETPARSRDTLLLERDEMLQFLIQANLKLQEYDQERSNFLARSIHEFRAPLTAMSGYCGLLLEEALGSLTSEQREALQRMQHSTSRLSRLTNSMFQLSVRGQVEKELNLERGDIQDCLEHALHEISLLLESKDIAITVEMEPGPETLFFDPSQMEQTLVNLLDNACRFTPRHGTIEIRGGPHFWERRTCESPAWDASNERRVDRITAPNAYKVDIRDSGPGIPPAHVASIFEEYASYSGGQDRSGGGLGLAICRMILQQHRGRIWAESQTAGAVFSFVIPLQSLNMPAAGGQKTRFASHLPTAAESWS
jgi:signal transduction histidine kinase